MLWMMSKTWSTSTGASPIEGSSIKSRRGRAMRARPIDPRVFELDAPGRGPDHAEDGLHRGRLPRRVPAQQTDDLPGAHFEVDGLEDLNGAVVGDDVGELKHDPPAARGTPPGRPGSAAPPRSAPRRPWCRGRGRRPARR